MSKPYLTLACACVLAVGGLAAAQAQAPASLSNDQIIAARQASLDLSAVNLGGMIHAADAGAEAKTQAFQANALARWSRVLPTLFPVGSGPGGATKTAAKPEIWSDRAGFEAKAGDYAQAAAKLADLAKAGDTAGFKAQLVSVRATCEACHAVYRAKPQG